ncbi:MAG: MFS transporter [Myxococcota bacterium]
MLTSRFNPWRSLVGLPREMWILAAANLVNRMGTMVLPFMALYLTGARGLSPSTAGMVLAVWGVTAVVAALVAGALADRLGALRVQRMSLVLSSGLLMAFPLAHDLPTILVMTVVTAAVMEAFRPANLALVTLIAPPEMRRQAFALNRLAVNLGMSLGPALGGFLATVSFTWLFVGNGISSLLAGVIVFAFLRGPRVERKVTTEKATSPTGGAWKDLRFLAFLLSMVPVAVVFFQHEAALPVYLVRHLGMSEAIYGSMFTVNTVLIVLLEVGVNAAMSGWSHRRSLALGCVLCGLGFGAFALVQTPLHAMLTVVVWTFGEMILFPGMSAYVAEAAPTERQGQYMGMYTMAFGVAFSFGPWLGTAILEAFGGPVTWAVMLVLGLVSAGAMAVVAVPRRATT